jgi:hypothetical protein
METLRFAIWDYELDQDIKPIIEETGKRFVDTPTGWAQFKDQAPKLLNKTARYWSWFSGDKFDMEEVVDEKNKCIHYSLTGKPNLKNLMSDKDDDPIQDWMGLVEYQICGKGTHEQFVEADLVPMKPDDWEDQVIIIQIYLENEIEERYRV